MKTNKICINCVHYEPKDSKSKANDNILWNNSKCALAKRYVSTDIVTGVEKEIFDHRRECSWQRIDGWLFCRLSKTCGREGRFFKEKENKNENAM